MNIFEMLPTFSIRQDVLNQKGAGDVPAEGERADTRVTLCSHSQHTFSPVHGIPEVSHG